MIVHRVPIAHHAVERDGACLTTVGLGSCVAIAIHDPRMKVGGLAHVLLPHHSIGRSGDNRARFASTAVSLLLEDMRVLGARGPFVAKIAGGARLFAGVFGAGGGMGLRNVEASRAALAAANVAVVGEDVGGDAGRSVSFDVGSGEVRVSSVRGPDRVL